MRFFLLFRKLKQLKVDADFVDDGTDELIGSAATGIVSRSDEVHTLLTEKLLCNICLLLIAWIIYSD